MESKDTTSNEKVKSNAPIGVFDSGLGGLSVLRTLRQNLPHENFVYLGDTARLPYGQKSHLTIHRYLHRNAEHLISTHQAKAIVIACNSASSAWRKEPIQFTIPTFDVIGPGAQTAVQVSPHLRIGVIGTRATVSEQAYVKAITALSPEAQVFQQACPLLVSLVEEGWVNDPLSNLVIYRYLSPLLSTGLDSLILGCTHFPFLMPSIQKITGSSVALIESGHAVLQQINEAFTSGNLPRACGHQPGRLEIHLTDLTPHQVHQVKQFLHPHNDHTIHPVDLC